ncbi:MAG: 50S ribosomal protein L29 [Vulcanimicrobiota bacterium]
MSKLSTFRDKLRELSLEELRGKLIENKEELFNLRFQLATGSLDNNQRIRQVKRDIARIHTVIREKELGLKAGKE